MAIIGAFIITLTISAIWYGVELIQFKELQWNRECDNVVSLLYFLVLWYLFAHQR